MDFGGRSEDAAQVDRLKVGRLKVLETRGSKFSDLRSSAFRVSIMRDHTKLRAFELADEVVVLVYRATAGFPKEELFGLTSQIRRAAVSVPSNIVEGCARESEAEYLRFLSIAFGSLRELHYQQNLSKRLGFLLNEDSSSLELKIVETEKVLNGLICALRD